MQYLSIESKNLFERENLLQFLAAGDLAIVTAINNISATHTPVSLLTQDDSHVSYCDAGNLPSNCDRNSICYCNHMVQLELCKNYEFFLIDNGSK